MATITKLQHENATKLLAALRGPLPFDWNYGNCAKCALEAGRVAGVIANGRVHGRHGRAVPFATPESAADAFGMTDEKAWKIFGKAGDVLGKDHHAVQQSDIADLLEEWLIGQTVEGQPDKGSMYELARELGCYPA